MKKKEGKQLKIFAPNFISSVRTKDQIDLMTFPFFSLSKKKRTTPIEYDEGQIKITVSNQENGIASIYDADILMYVISQIVEAKNKNIAISPTIRISQYDILEFLGRGTGGREYNFLKASLKRLKTTLVSTTIQREGSRFKAYKLFNWIEELEIVEKNGKPVAIRFRLCDWLFKGIEEGKVLTVPKYYFRIDGGLERFIYKLCRKTAGRMENGYLRMKLSTVHKRSGITQAPSRFRKMVEKIITNQSVPDYWISLVKHPKSKDDYLCGLSKLHYATPEKAKKNIEFIDFDDILEKNKPET